MDPEILLGEFTPRAIEGQVKVIEQTIRDIAARAEREHPNAYVPGLDEAETHLRKAQHFLQVGQFAHAFARLFLANGYIAKATGLASVESMKRELDRVLGE